MATKRVVQVFIADPDPDVPPEKSMLYQGNVQVTDSTDQELFYEVPIKDLLDKHNEFRKTITDPEQGGDRERFLEPIRIRDLGMVVVTIASFPER